MHTSDTSPDPTCRPCLDHEEHESVVRLKPLLLDVEVMHPGGAWIDSTLSIDALDVRYVLDLVRSA